ncbi:MAG: ketosteroid isomerase-like protein [Oleiphilaceae bacterium]
MITKEKVLEIFEHLESGSPEKFFEFVDDNVKWEVTGTHPLAGIYHSKIEFIESTMGRLNAVLESNLSLKVINCFTDGKSASIELIADSRAKNGMAFNNRYCWICEFSGERIVNVRAYLDSALVASTLQNNEQN